MNELDISVGQDFEKIQMTNRQIYFDKIMTPIFDLQAKDLDKNKAPEYSEV